MRILFASMAAMTMAFQCGCTQSTTGGPGAYTQGPVIGKAEDTFTLVAPAIEGDLPQGGRSAAAVGIKRAKNFDQDVTLKFADVPEGVSIEPDGPVIKHGDAETKITVRATDKAARGDFKVTVTGRPTKGADAETSFKFSVVAQDGFSLIMPNQATFVKQGETKAISIGIQRAQGFDQDVTLTFGDLPRGVTFDPEVSIIKHGETEAQVTLAAASDAALGEFAIKVIGRPATGADASSALQITVAKE